MANELKVIDRHEPNLDIEDLQMKAQEATGRLWRTGAHEDMLNPQDPGDTSLQND